ncbi:hypothetical protein V1505DRAFT_389279 [Lipomyces doorenjongii]
MNVQALNLQLQNVVSISTLTAVANLGDLKTQIKAGLDAELDAGLTVDEVKEALAHLYAYENVCFPKLEWNIHVSGCFGGPKRPRLRPQLQDRISIGSNVVISVPHSIEVFDVSEKHFRNTQKEAQRRFCSKSQ